MELLKLKHVLLFKFLKTKVCSCFIVTHVVVPSLRKFQKLRLLRSLDILKFLLLCRADIIFLPLSFLSKQLLELRSALAGFSVISIFFAFSAIFFEKTQKV